MPLLVFCVTKQWNIIVYEHTKMATIYDKVPMLFCLKKYNANQLQI